MSTPQPPSGPPEDHPPGAEEVGDGWRRVHPVTPVLQVWQVVVAIIAVLVFQVGQELTANDGWGFVQDHLGTVLLLLGGGLLAAVLLAAVYSTIAWRRMRYRVDAAGVELNKGILFRQERRAALDRVQAVDVQQPLLGRIFGLARVRVETAGGGDSNVDVAFLRLTDAEALRAEILARAAGVDLEEIRETVAEVRQGPDATGRLGRVLAGRGADPLLAARTGYREAPEHVVFEVDNGRLIAATMLSAGFVVVAVCIVGALGLLLTPVPLATAALFVPGILSAGGFVWSRFSGSFSFRSATSPDGIRLRRGLLETTSQTVPPRRVQAVRLRQPWLWRWRGWWRVEAYIAGYGISGDNLLASSGTLMPVGTRAEALTAMWLVVPDLGADDLPATLDAALEGSGDAAGFVTSPRRARWLDPMAWRRQAALVTREAILMRSGWLTRTLEVVPHGRTQSVGLTQGPIERRLGLANLFMHTVPGPGMPHVQHLDELVALDLLRHQAERAREARHREGPEEWARRVEAALPDADEVDAGPPAPGDPVVAAPGTRGPAPDSPAPDSPAPDSPAPAEDAAVPDADGPVPQVPHAPPVVAGGAVPGPGPQPRPGSAGLPRGVPAEVHHTRGPDAGGWSPSGTYPAPFPRAARDGR